MKIKTIKILILLLVALAFSEVTVYAEDLAGTVVVTHDGTPQYGETVGADTTGLTNNTGTLSYQWIRDGADIVGETGAFYTLAEADIGAAVGVSVTSSVETGAVASQTVIAAKADRAAPAAPTLQSRDHYNVELTAVSGCEYKVAGDSFSSTNTFTDLKSNTEYVFYQRYEETAGYNASPISAALHVSTEYLTLSNTSCNISTLNAGDGVLVSGSVTLNGTQSIRVRCSEGATLTLQNVSINVSSLAGECGVEFAGASGRLVLSGYNNVISGSGRGGIEASGNLIVSGSGSLYAKGGTGGAGIAGDSISVTGGLIFAAGNGGDDIGGGHGTLSISGSSAVFLKNNLSPTPTAGAHSFCAYQNVLGGRAYGYSLPAAWAEGSIVYAYIDWCSVTFEASGGTSTADQTVGKLSKVEQPAEPTKTEMYFDRWYTDASLTNDFHFANDKVYGDITLYAGWNVKVNVEASDGGSVSPLGEVFVKCGENLDIECTPIENYAVEVITSAKDYTITANGDNTYTVENIAETDTINVFFESTVLLGTVTIDHDSTPQCRETVGVNTTKVENGRSTLLYQWTRDGQDISGATGKKYILAVEDLRHIVGVKVTSSEKDGALFDTIAMKIEKAMKAAPRPPKVIGRTTSSITLEIVEGCEYKIDDGEWQDANVFTDLEPETEYTFYQRYKASSSHKVSNFSFALKIYTEGFNVAEIELSEHTLLMNKGDSEQAEVLLEYVIYPENAQNQNVIWSSSNHKAVVIDEDGILKAVGNGKAAITVTALDDKNGVISDTCFIQVYDFGVVPAGAYEGKLSGNLEDSEGNALSGYVVVLYSSPQEAVTDHEGEYDFGDIAYTEHTIVVEDKTGTEIGRYEICWTSGEQEKAVLDEEDGVINIVYTEHTLSISIPLIINDTYDGIEIPYKEGIAFTVQKIEEEQQEKSSPARVYILILMGVIAALIIGVGYVLYIGRIKRNENTDGILPTEEPYEQPLLAESRGTDISEDDKKIDEQEKPE